MKDQFPKEEISPLGLEKKSQTIKTYKESARALAEKFDGIGVRADDIAKTFNILKIHNPSTLEIGCGNGRDAVEILKRTNNYIGLDISDELIEFAKEKNPEATFVVADIEDYSFPKNLDAIFAFASLIHVSKESLKKILSEALSALNKGGVLRLSMKQAGKYTESTQEDRFGIRTYYLYSKEDIEECVKGYIILKNDLRQAQGQAWIEVLLQKP